ncbi:unnamed protein product [Caenorhabditis sp. 36 PRJEB53466]|nr:unnamed protein product [Caenorhabditis sp. 36 PRJEB53466]
MSPTTRVQYGGTKGKTWNNLAPEIHESLQRIYESEKYPSAERKEKIAQYLGLDVNRVDRWFEGRRNVTRKENSAGLKVLQRAYANDFYCEDQIDELELQSQFPRHFIRGWFTRARAADIRKGKRVPEPTGKAAIWARATNNKRKSRQRLRMADGQKKGTDATEEEEVEEVNYNDMEYYGYGEGNSEGQPSQDYYMDGDQDERNRESSSSSSANVTGKANSQEPVYDVDEMVDYQPSITCLEHKQQSQLLSTPIKLEPSVEVYMKPVSAVVTREPSVVAVEKEKPKQPVFIKPPFIEDGHDYLFLPPNGNNNWRSWSAQQVTAWARNFLPEEAVEVLSEEKIDGDVLKKFLKGERVWKDIGLKYGDFHHIQKLEPCTSLGKAGTRNDFSFCREISRLDFLRMAKIMKPGKVCLVLRGRFAGRKAVVIKAHDDGASDRTYPHAVIAGIDRNPLKVNQSMGKKKIAP